MIRHSPEIATALRAIVGLLSLIIVAEFNSLLHTSSNGCVLRARYKLNRSCNISENIPQALASFFLILCSFIGHIYNMTLGGIKDIVISYMTLTIQINITWYNTGGGLLIHR